MTALSASPLQIGLPASVATTARSYSRGLDVDPYGCDPEFLKLATDAAVAVDCGRCSRGAVVQTRPVPLTGETA